MTVFRLARSRYEDLTGEGARRFGGRCNERGVAALYCSEHLSLCVLEVLVHLQKEDSPDGYQIYQIELTGDFKPKYGSPEEAKASGGRDAVWIVPSQIVPEENNIVFYPSAGSPVVPVIRKQRNFQFDDRLLNTR